MNEQDQRIAIWVFGKEGCAKCKALQRRLKKILADEQWSDFEMQYFDVETEDGMVRFCRVECVNPNRIPAFVLAVPDDASSTGWRLLPNPAPGAADAPPGTLRAILGIQTDYTGTGTITPAMITWVLTRAREALACPTTP